MEQILIYGIIFIVVVFFLSGLRVINQYERAVKLRFGAYRGVLRPGLGWIIPIVDRIQRMDIRQRTIDLQKQEVLSKDNVNLSIDGVVFYTVDEPENAFLNVEDIRKQLNDKATTELKGIIGDMTMQESLMQREKIGTKLKDKLNRAVLDEGAEISKRKKWGVNIRAVQINNIELPKELIRAMAKQAEAEREKEARRTKAEGEEIASKKFAEASKIYEKNPSALKLRELQTWQEIGIEQNSLIIVVPSGMTDVSWTIPLGEKVLSKGKK